MGSGCPFVDHMLLGAAFRPQTTLEFPTPCRPSRSDKRHKDRDPRTEGIEKCHPWAKTSGIILLSLIEKNLLDVCVIKK